MSFMTFKTREEAEAEATKRQNEALEKWKSPFIYSVEERFVIKRKIELPGAPDEYLMGDGSFKEYGEGDLVYPEFDPSLHIV